jgi:tetratricopeptide (TPR) repeat protein
MRWLQAEYLLKGVYLGLLLFVALHESDWFALALVSALALGGLALTLGIAAVRKAREGYQIRGRVPAFILFLLLESPELVFAGIILGMAAGGLAIRKSASDSWLLAGTAIGGALLGGTFWLLRYVRQRGVRIGLSLAGAIVLVGGALLWFGQLGEFGEQLGLVNPIKNTTVFGVQLLLGIPLFYLLTFAGREEETEVEIGAMCAALGLGSAMLARTGSSIQTVGLIVPIMFYFWYTSSVLPRLRVFKHALRGFSYSRVGRHRQAILSFRRALQFEPQNKLAREGLWGVHRSLDLKLLAGDPQMVSLLDFALCLERAGFLLLEPKPSQAKLEEAQRLLDLVLGQRPALRAPVHYWRAVAHTHERRYDQAADELRQVLDPRGYDAGNPERQKILLQAWLLALRLHAELARRVGAPELALPGRRMEAIAAVERHLAANADDAEVWAFKRALYHDLTEAEYDTGARAGGSAADFDHELVHQLGLALIGDPTRWQRGGEFLRMAARGLPLQCPSIFTQLAQAYQEHGDAENAWRQYEQVRAAGQAAGPKNLSAEDRQAYFAALRIMGDAALTHGEIETAIANYQLYSEYERSGLETLRTLADLYERKGDALLALRVVEQALVYNPKDADLLQRKDRYYYSVMPDDLRARMDIVSAGFDVGYCLKKSRALLDAKNWDLDTLDWVQHLADLAFVARPQSMPARVLIARARLRRGEKEEAAALLEDIRAAKPEKFPSAEDEEAWFLATKLLGELYLYDFNKPDLAIQCFKDFRQSPKSGADTMYKLGQAYEALGDRARAVSSYKHVVAYDSHPLAPDAHDALQRLQAN